MSDDKDKQLASLRSALEQANLVAAALRQQRDRAQDEVVQLMLAGELQARELAKLRAAAEKPEPAKLVKKVSG